MSKSVLKSKLAFILFVVIASSCASIIFSESKFGKAVETQTLDWRMRWASHYRHPDTSVVIVTVDQGSLRFFLAQEVAWPWPREFYSALLDYLHEGGAKAVAFDMDFSQKDLDRLNVDAVESDSSFALSIRKSDNVVLITVLASGDSVSVGNESVQDRFMLHGVNGELKIPHYNSSLAPLTEFQQATRRLGAANFIVDDDGVARRIPLLFMLNNGLIPQLSIAAYSVGKNLNGRELNNFICSVPTDRNGYYLLNWYGKGGPDGVFKYYSISSLIVSAVQLKQGAAPEISPSVFKDKYVIVGGSAVGLMDFVSTPFTAYEPFPGAEIHATILSNLLKRDYLRELSPSTSWVIIMALSLLVTGVFVNARRVSVTTLIAAAALLAYLYIAFSAMSSRSVWLPLVGPELSVLTTLGFSGVVSYVTEGRRRRELKRLMNRYLSPEVVDEISADPDKIDFAGRELEATIFFSDIHDFTAASEKLKPKELVSSLNEYFTLVTEVVLNSGAMLDKYIGDSVMAVYGAPLPMEDHPARACLAALQIQYRLSRFYSTRRGSAPAFETRIGLNTGKIVLGNIGSVRRLDYTAIGDSVNLASRLEGANKEFGTKILVSESTYELAKGTVDARELDLVRVKGKEIPVRIFELVCEKGRMTPAEMELAEMFQEGLSFYRQREWERAVKIFLEILNRYPNDGPSKAYVARCRRLLEVGVPENWDGVYVMTTK